MFILGNVLERIEIFFVLIPRLRINALKLLRGKVEGSYFEDPGVLSDPHNDPLVQIYSDVLDIENALTDVVQFYAGEQPVTELNAALSVLTKIKKIIDDISDLYGSPITTRRIFTGFLFGDTKLQDAYKDLSKSIVVLQRKIQLAISSMANFSNTELPFSLPVALKNHVSLKQISDKPQATVQLAFTVFEDHLRNRL